MSSSVGISWDDEIPNVWKVIQNSMVPVTTNQPILLTDHPIAQPLELRVLTLEIKARVAFS